MSKKNYEELIKSIIKYLECKEYNLTELKDIEIIIEKILKEILDEKEQQKNQLEQCIELLENQYVHSIKECFEIK